MISNTFIRFAAPTTTRRRFPFVDVRNWLVGSKGLSTMAKECESLSFHPTSDIDNIERRRNLQEEHRTVVSRYSRLLVHSSSWDLLSPKEILTCLGAASLPLHSAGSSSMLAGSGDHQKQHEVFAVGGFKAESKSSTSQNHRAEEEQKLNAAQDSFIPPVTHTFGDTEFSSKVWAAALPSLSSVVSTISGSEAASLLRSVHRLGVAVPPSMLQTLARAITLSLSATNNNNNDNSTSNKIRTAHALASQASLLVQTQQRHFLFALTSNTSVAATTPKQLYETEVLSSCLADVRTAVASLLYSSVVVAADAETNDRLSEALWSDLCVAIEAVSLVAELEKQQQSKSNDERDVDQLVTSLHSIVNELVSRCSTRREAINDSTSISLSQLQHAFPCVARVQSVKPELASDLYAALTRVLGRKFAAVNNNARGRTTPSLTAALICCAVEMERAALAVFESSSSGVARAAMMSTRQEPVDKKNDSIKNSIFRGERHSLDAPLILESVATFLSSAAVALKHESKQMIMRKKSSVGEKSNGNDEQPEEEGAAASNAAVLVPACLSALSVWGAYLPEIRDPALVVLTHSIRSLQPTQLVRTLQALACMMRVPDRAQLREQFGGSSSSAALNVNADVDLAAESVAAILTPSIASELLAALYVSYRDLPCVGCCLALRAVAELTAPAVKAEREEEQASGGATLSESGARKMRQILRDGDDENSDPSSSSRDASEMMAIEVEHRIADAAEEVARRIPHVARTLCVKQLSSRVYELALMESERGQSSTRRSNNSMSSSSSSSSSSSLLTAHQLLSHDCDSAAVRNGFESMIVLEHVGESLGLLNMLPTVVVPAAIPPSSSSPSGAGCSSASSGSSSSSSSSSASTSKDAAGFIRKRQPEQRCVSVGAPPAAAAYC